MSARDLLSFMRVWRASPARVGAVLPSGAPLAEVITSEISAASGLVMELGPGTGVFTRALLTRGVNERGLLLIDASPEFVALLAARFPAARVLAMDATRLKEQPLYDGAPLGAVVSGIPLLNLAPQEIDAIVDGAFRFLRPDGAFYQFTYGPRCPVPPTVLERLGLEAKRIGGTLLNMPPASVYRIKRKNLRS